MSVSTLINHTPWVGRRREALGAMLAEFPSYQPNLRIHDTDYRGRPWQAAKVDWALYQWEWAASQPTTHHLFMTDDLNLAPGFTTILEAMISAHPEDAIGLLSNHPKGPALAAQGCSGYYTNSWLVGPAYVLPKEMLVRFLAWFKTLPDGPYTTPGTKAYRNDDSSFNEWSTHGGGPGRVWHPLPTIVEHRGDIVSTVGHGDRYSRERISWRQIQHPVEGEAGIRWRQIARTEDLHDMRSPEFWMGHHPMLAVGGEEEAADG